MPQINARLSREIRKRFEQYAAEIGLDASELARLLIVRAMRRQRNLGPPMNSAKIQARGVQRKLTAHFHQQENVDEFDRYALAMGLRRAAAAKLIFENELDERWLAHALLWAPRKPKLLP
jgi:hypothetical protein